MLLMTYMNTRTPECCRQSGKGKNPQNRKIFKMRMMEQIKKNYLKVFLNENIQL